ncbi:hypothetical protein VCHA43P277_160016 [Vibrio chagasii]|nr:hypothetical protein VCHA34P126_140028 [Vibrio chagasii]CAH6976978.1 hypothetical protein VCHA43P277_160016 [Vibrio chagasii]CAH7025990.1 hypothetical protein VCHA41O247_160017 [Vibrio chagasii]CAH7248332.1 hypothetical protein VCHA50P420_160102 [Vibrio chagasii]
MFSNDVPIMIAQNICSNNSHNSLEILRKHSISTQWANLPHKSYL